MKKLESRLEILEIRDFIEEVLYYADDSGNSYIPNRSLSAYRKDLGQPQLEIEINLLKGKINNLSKHTIEQVVWRREKDPFGPYNIITGLEVKLNKNKLQKILHNLVPEENLIIKNIKLNALEHLLEINNGAKVISFRTDRGDESTKSFKLLHELYKHRAEVKKNKIINQSHYLTLAELAKVSGSKTNKAVLQHIKRLNDLFQTHRLPMEVDRANNQFQLKIHLN